MRRGTNPFLIVTMAKGAFRGIVHIHIVIPTNLDWNIYFGSNFGFRLCFVASSAQTNISIDFSIVMLTLGQTPYKEP